MADSLVTDVGPNKLTTEQAIGYLATQNDVREMFSRLVDEGKLKNPRAVAIELRRRGWNIPDELYKK